MKPLVTSAPTHQLVESAPATLYERASRQEAEHLGKQIADVDGIIELDGTPLAGCTPVGADTQARVETLGFRFYPLANGGCIVAEGLSEHNPDPRDELLFARPGRAGSAAGSAAERRCNVNRRKIIKATIGAALVPVTGYANTGRDLSNPAELDAEKRELQFRLATLSEQDRRDVELLAITLNKRGKRRQRTLEPSTSL